MGGRIYRRLGELPTGESAIVVRCRRCGRRAMFRTHELACYWRIKRWDDDWRSVPPRLRCAPPPGCGQRAPEIWYALKADWEPFVSDFTELPSPAPNGVPQWLWNMARSEADRKKLIRRARG